MNAVLTAKQQKFYEKLRDYILKRGVSPTVRELQKMHKYASHRAVTQYLQALEKKGLIARSRYRARSIKLLTPEGDTVNVPVFASAGCDNLSILAERVFDEFICVAKDLLQGRNHKKVVGIRASGNSMDDAGITDGDYVLVEATESIEPNDLVVAIVDNCAVIKKIEFANNAVILRPVSTDPSYKPIILNRDFRIFGKVLDVIRPGRAGTPSELEVVPLYSK